MAKKISGVIIQNYSCITSEEFKSGHTLERLFESNHPYNRNEVILTPVSKLVINDRVSISVSDLGVTLPLGNFQVSDVEHDLKVTVNGREYWKQIRNQPLMFLTEGDLLETQYTTQEKLFTNIIIISKIFRTNK